MTKKLLLFLYCLYFLFIMGCASHGDRDSAYDTNNPYTQYKLGMQYLLGQGVVQDNTIAYRWFEKSARQGNPYAENELGYLYAIGKGVTQNDATAIQWYQKAADHGLASAQYNLGLFDANGLAHR